MRSVRHFSSIDSYINSFNTDFYIESHDINLLNELDDLVDSSYSKNLYSKLFYFLSSHFKPGNIAEFGVLGCYSIISMAMGAKSVNIENSIIGYDLFEDYEFTSFAFSDALKRIKYFGLSDSIKLKRCNALKGNLIEDVLLTYDLVHIDLSNEGKLYERVFSSKFKKDSIILMEGGSFDRDKNTWINKYGAKEILPVINNFQKKRPDLKISIIDVFPSLTIIQT
tara:strand:- start:44 stop:715 length:672 start_codon:yes stop_codon:yes gene_type:complete